MQAFALDSEKIELRQDIKVINSPSLQYPGEKISKNENHEISRNYEVIGNITVNAGYFVSTEKMQLKLMEEA